MDNDVPRPMAFVGCLYYDEAKLYVDMFNETVSDNKKIYIALINSDIAFVLSGSADSFFDFRVRYFNEFQEKQVRWKYLSAKVPFHSPYFNSTKDKYHQIKELIGKEFYGKDLRLPVYCTFSGVNMQGQQSLWDTMYEHCLLKPCNWLKCMAEVKEHPNISTIIDCGPGISSAYITNCLAAHKYYELLFAPKRKDLNQLLNPINIVFE